jgi:enamine deaminase RidA (YjgF/YER057c/UK114 family)
MSIESKIQELGMELPPAPKAIASYIPAKSVKNLVFTSGQLPLKNGELVAKGKVGKNLSILETKIAAETACLNALAAIKGVVGSLESIENIIKITVFVASEPDFFEHHLVANHISDLLVLIFGEKGKHARSALGVASLPLNAALEVEMLVETK